MTPSKQIKAQITDFQTTISNEYSRVVLNKSRPKKDTFINILGETCSFDNKGVNSDLIFIFKTNKEEESNFSFIFDYIDKEEADYSVTVSFKPIHINKDNNISKFHKLKLNDDLIISEKFSVKEFKDKLSNLNKELKTKEINKDIILNLINQYFFDNTINIEREIKKSKNKLNKIKDNYSWF